MNDLMDLHAQVSDFLKDLKSLVDAGNVTYKDRKKNRDALIQNYLTEGQRDQEIASLEVSNYCSGPDEDTLKPGRYYWVFGKIIRGQLFYIKVQIFTDRDGDDHLSCMSFHPAEFSLCFPFGQSR